VIRRRHQSRSLYGRGMYTWADEAGKYREPLCFHPEKFYALLAQNEKTRTGTRPMMRGSQLRKRGLGRLWEWSFLCASDTQSGGIFPLV
jgi:hypothetical protein